MSNLLYNVSKNLIIHIKGKYLKYTNLSYNMNNDLMITLLQNFKY